MDLQSRKLQFIWEFLKIDDEKVISGLEKLLADHHTIITQEQLNQEADEALNDAANGRIKTAGQLKAEIDHWK